MGDLIVDGLTAGYTRAPVLQDLSLEVRGNEIVGLLGANGAGKTTLLRALAGAVRAWQGRVLLDDVDVTRWSPWRRVRGGIAHVQEGRHVFTGMSVEENLAVAGLVAEDPRVARDRVFALFPRLLERRTQAAGFLSGGEQQMLAIGRALMTEPRFLLVDELSAGLAPLLARELVVGLRDVHSQGLAVLIVEQSPKLIADVVDRVYLLERGRIRSEGTMDDLGGVSGVAAAYLGVRAEGTARASGPRPGPRPADDALDDVRPVRHSHDRPNTIV
jgi:branched-chain amino acid transport system ATP-binding protein